MQAPPPLLHLPNSAARLSPEGGRVRVRGGVPGAQAQAEMAACRASLREGSYTFYAASLILPRAVREPASALYAFCRMADDEVDNGADKHAAVARLHALLDDTYSGRPRAGTADRALAAVVSHFNLPRTLLDALLEGFEWDAQGRRYHTMEDLQDYAARVAGTVGAMMAVLMGVRTPEGLARACDLGVAMQLSNIARDVGEDARMGRLYLPQQWMREAGLDPKAWLDNPVFNPQLASVVQRVLDAADVLYQRVDAGVAQLPLSCRPGINAARYLYAAIGHEVARRGLDSVTQRAVVPRSRKLALLVRALVNLNPPGAPQPAPCLRANRFLVDAAVAQSLPPVLPTSASTFASARAPWWRVDKRLEERVVWVIALFERLERNERVARAAGSSV